MSDASLTLQLDEDRLTYHFGERLGGTIEVRASVPWKVQLFVAELLWKTSGRGNVDSDIATRIQLAEPNSVIPETATYRFDIVVPDGPQSYSGKLIKLNWTLQIELDPRGGKSRYITVPIRILDRKDEMPKEEANVGIFEDIFEVPDLPPPR